MFINKNLQKCMFEFLEKFENLGIKIARINSIIITKSIKFTLILYDVEVRCNRGRFFVNSPFIEKSMIQVKGYVLIFISFIRL